MKTATEKSGDNLDGNRLAYCQSPIDEYAIGDKVLVGNNLEVFEVYEEASRDGTHYKALRGRRNSKTGAYGEYNGKLESYIKGCWGGIRGLV